MSSLILFIVNLEFPTWPRKSYNRASDLRQNAWMADRYRAPGGFKVEVVCLSGTPDRHDGQWLRARRHGAWTADVRTVGELEQWFSLGSLERETLALAV